MRSLALAVAAVALLTAAAPPKYRKIDIHTHFGPNEAARTVQIMDHYGIDTVCNLSGGSPGQGLEEQLAAAARFPGRIVVFTLLDWHQAERGPGYGARMAADLPKAKALGARGVKIPQGLGLGYRDYRRQLIAVDDPELDIVFETAGKLGMPVIIHVGDPVAFWRPPSIDNERYAELLAHPGWSFWHAGVPEWEDLYAAFERRVARHPRTIIIGAHFGNAPEYPQRVAAMLDKYPNFYVDTAARVPELGRQPAKVMHDLMIKYQDRILFGTDLGVGAKPEDLMLGSTGTRTPTLDDMNRFFSATWRYFETWDKHFAHPTPIQGDWTIDGIGLPPDVLRKIYGGNAARLLGL